MFQSPQYVYHEGEGSVAIAKGAFDEDLNTNNLTVTWNAMSIRNKLAKYYKVQIYADNLIVEEYLEEVNSEDLEIEKNYNFYEFFQNNDWENMVFSAVIYPLLDNKLPTKVYFASDVTKFVCNLHIELTKEEAEEEGDPNNVECETTNGTLPLTYNWDVNGEKTSVGPINDTTNLLEDITLSEEEDTVVTCTVIDGMGCIEERKIIFEIPQELNPDEGFYQQGVGFIIGQWNNAGKEKSSFLNIFIPESKTEVVIYHGKDLSKKEIYVSNNPNETLEYKNLIDPYSLFEIHATKPIISFVYNLQHASSGAYEVPPKPHTGNEYYITRFDGRLGIKNLNITSLNNAFVCPVSTKDDPNPIADIYIDDVFQQTISYPNEYYKFYPKRGDNAQKISSNKPIAVFYSELLNGGLAYDLTTLTLTDNDRCGLHYIVPCFRKSNKMAIIIISIEDNADIILNTAVNSENINIPTASEIYTKEIDNSHEYLEIISNKKVQVLFSTKGSHPDMDLCQCHPVDAGIKRSGFYSHVTDPIDSYELNIITHENADEDNFSIIPNETINWSPPTSGGYKIGRVLNFAHTNIAHFISAQNEFVAYILGDKDTENTRDKYDSVLHSLGRNWTKEY